ncbi:hypothetical protein [uncultured Bartonella sp.]|uniref:hypothetical protein n=1 Tax=uncultured Bartonella sp. TaxID=104108 RepID=UPI0026391E86|nr:hypothetical protein [uncultured Bartonella sp.]
MLKFLNGDDAKEKIEKRIHALKEELASLTKNQSWFDNSFDAGEIAGTIKDKSRQALDIVGEQAHNLTKQTKNYPKTTTLAIIGVVGVAAYFLFRKK